MPERDQVKFLRESAGRLREIANIQDTPLSDELQIMAADLDAQADALERAGLTTTAET